MRKMESGRREAEGTKHKHKVEGARQMVEGKRRKVQGARHMAQGRRRKAEGGRHKV